MSARSAIFFRSAATIRQSYESRPPRVIRSLLSRAAAREASIYKSPTLSRARERYCFEDCFFFSFFSRSGWG